MCPRADKPSCPCPTLLEHTDPRSDGPGSWRVVRDNRCDLLGPGTTAPRGTRQREAAARSAMAVSRGGVTTAGMHSRKRFVGVSPGR